MRASVALLACLIAGTAHAGDAASCAAASLRGQTDHDHGRYLSARSAFVECANSACPALIQKDCGEWLAQLEPQIPSVVLAMRDSAGRDVATTRVLLDGAPLVDKLDGRPVAVDPGEHVFRFELTDGQSVDQHAIIRASETARPITAVLARKLVVMPVVVMPVIVKPPAARAATVVHADGRDSKRALAAVFGVTGVALVGLFVGFGLSGEADIQQLRTTCAPYCAQAQLDAVQVKLVAADVSLLLGIASAAVATVFLISSFAVTVAPRAGGGVLGIVARY